MVSIRCKLIVKAALEKVGLRFGAVDLGEVEILDGITSQQRERLDAMLKSAGLELMDDKKAILIEKIKAVIIEMVHYSDERPTMKFSNYLSEKLQYDYTYLANLFSDVTGITVEHYIIAHKIERAKELLIYDKLSLRGCLNSGFRRKTVPFSAVHQM